MGSANLTGRGELGSDFLTIVGTRIRELRTARSMTVQQLADRAQISRRLMTQIEHGQANPSLVTVTRIARQLDTEFTALLEPAVAESPIAMHIRDEHMLVWTSDAGSTAHLLEATQSRSADLWLWRLMPGDTYRGLADPAQSQELFYVVSGTLTLSTDDEEVSVGAGSSATLRSDRSYTYRNVGKTPTEFVRTVALSS
jgi:transcriptional regulator with XRE-family HTH domain